MTDHTDDAAWYYADMLAYQQGAEAALRASAERVLSPDEISLIAFVGRIDIKEKK